MRRRALESGEICVVHLSDLHFDVNRYKPIYDALLEDLKIQLRNDRQIVLVVTGDLSTRGNVNACRVEILGFFKKLAPIISKNKQLLSVEIIPGNHDVERPTILNKFHNSTFVHKSDEYDRLHKRIYKIFEEFGVEKKDKVGVTCIAHKGKNIAFVRLDTSSFATLGDWQVQVKEDFAKNKKKIVRGRYKGLLDKDVVGKMKEAFERYATEQQIIINNEFKKLSTKNKKIYLTFALSHHPLTLLNTTGFDNLADILFKRSLYFVDAMVCGHMHKAQLYYTMENAQQKIMLMSGIGWQESQATSMRYSIYRICLERNICQVSVRKTTEGREFHPDGDVAKNAQVEFETSEQYSFPLKSTQVGSVIYLSTAHSELSRGLFVDQETIALLPKVEACLQEFRRGLELAIVECWNNLRIRDARCLIRRDEILLSLRNGATSLSTKTRKVIRRYVIERGMLGDFFYDICAALVDAIGKVPPLSVSSDPDGNKYFASKPFWRVHWRSYEKSDDSYFARGFCVSENGQAAKPAKIGWKGLIEGAFCQCRKMMVNSSVPGLNEHALDKWSDFMTLCPAFPGSVIDVGGQSGSNPKLRPLMTMGISFRAEDFDALQHASRILYLLEYLNVNSVIEASICRFVDVFGLDKDCVEKSLGPDKRRTKKRE